MAPVADVRPCAIYLQGLCPLHLHRCSREACRKFPHTCFLHEDVSDRSTSLACSNSYDEQTVDKDLSSKYSAHKCDHSRSLHPVFSSKAELNLVASLLQIDFTHSHCGPNHSFCFCCASTRCSVYTDMHYTDGCVHIFYLRTIGELTLS